LPSTWRVWKRKTTKGETSGSGFLLRLTRVFRFKKQFSTYLADDIGSADIEDIYKNAYAAIREDPTHKPTEKSQDWTAETKKHKTPRLTREQRMQNIAAKIEAFKAGAKAADDDDDEDDE
jgi:large subunit ribosomal protein L5e